MFTLKGSFAFDLRWFRHNIRAIMAKIKLPKKPLSMIIFWIGLRRSHQLSSWPRERKLNLKLFIFQLKRTCRVSWKHFRLYHAAAVLSWNRGSAWCRFLESCQTKITVACPFAQITGRKVVLASLFIALSLTESWRELGSLKFVEMLGKASRLVTFFPFEMKR